jgi:hypothetical protein
MAFFKECILEKDQFKNKTNLVNNPTKKHISEKNGSPYNSSNKDNTHAYSKGKAIMACKKMINKRPYKIMPDLYVLKKLGTG